MRNYAGTDSIENLMFGQTSFLLEILWDTWSPYDLYATPLCWMYFVYLYRTHTSVQLLYHPLHSESCILNTTFVALKVVKHLGEAFQDGSKRTEHHITYRDEMEIHPRNFTTGLFSLKLAQHVRILEMEQTKKILWFQNWYPNLSQRRSHMLVKVYLIYLKAGVGT